MRRFVVGLLFTAASVFLLGRLIDWSATAEALKRADPWFIAAAISCLVVSLIFKTFRWRMLLPADAGVTTPRLYRILHISFMLNNVLPARLGDVARVAMATKQPGIRLGHVLSSLLTERVTDAVTLLTCFIVVSPFLPIPDAYVSWLETAWYVLAALVGLTIIGIVTRRRVSSLATKVPLPERISRSERLRDEARSFGDGWRQLFAKDHLVAVWGSSALAWVGAFAINYLLMRALEIDAPITVAVLVTCTTNLAMLLPSSPGYIGVFHAAATLALLPFGVGAASALSFAILAHLVNVLPVTILGAFFLIAGRDTASLGGLFRGRGSLFGQAREARS